MKRHFLLVLIFLYSSLLMAQNTFTAVIKDKETQEPLAGATVLLKGTNNGSSADENGMVEIKNVPDGYHVFIISFIGYKEQSFATRFPSYDDQYEIFLSAHEEEMQEIIVTATRTSRTIDDIPTRVEAISGEELEEKGNMKPGDIRMMLNESTGIQTQQTSAISYNSSIRIQGLDGKYTQILKDGYPLFAGYSGGLGLLQIAPLDLKQVEVIKGASSTLYGGGAIAGLVNLVSKTPVEEKELNFLLNATSALGLDASGFYSQKFKKTGVTVFASYNSGKPYDPANIGLTAIPKFNRATLNPKLFLYFSPKTALELGINTTIEERIGGDIQYLQGEGDSIHAYFERNNTKRISSQLGFHHSFDDGSSLMVKNSISYYDRTIEIPEYYFSGVQVSTYTEATFELKQNKLDWIVGINILTEEFRQDKSETSNLVDYHHSTYGAFLQNTWTASGLFALETGLRADYQDNYGFFLLPRISTMFRFNKFSARLGGGLGYKTPTVFTEDAERLQFRNVLPIDLSKTKAELSYGVNLDFNYRTALTEQMTFSINTLLFYTQILKPLILTALNNGFYEFLQQPGGYIDTKGLEINAKLTYHNFKLFLGYTLADVNLRENGTFTGLTLVAKHRLNNILMFEIHEKWKVGLEAYYYSQQKLSDGSKGRSYWILGVMAEKIWDHFSVFVNFENLLDTRQTRFGNIYTGTITNPVFRDIYAPVDGFVINGGLKIRL